MRIMERLTVQINNKGCWEDFLGHFSNLNNKMYECLDYFKRKDRYKDKTFRITRITTRGVIKKIFFEGTIEEIQDFIREVKK